MTLMLTDVITDTMFRNKLLTLLVDSVGLDPQKRVSVTLSTVLANSGVAQCCLNREKI
jgi:hypothetical protein